MVYALVGFVPTAVNVLQMVIAVYVVVQDVRMNSLQYVGQMAFRTGTVVNCNWRLVGIEEMSKFFMMALVMAVKIRNVNSMPFVKAMEFQKQVAFVRNIVKMELKPKKYVVMTIVLIAVFVSYGMWLAKSDVIYTLNIWAHVNRVPE